MHNLLVVKVDTCLGGLESGHLLRRTGKSHVITEHARNLPATYSNYSPDYCITIILLAMELNHVPPTAVSNGKSIEEAANIINN